MGIHEFLRPEKLRWKKIRKERDFESIREGYNELKLKTPTNETIPYIQQIVDDFLKIGVSKDTKLLDAGSGSGVVCRHFKESGFTDISAFDISDENVESTRPYANNVFLSTCEDIKADSSTYDVVVCNGVIEHCMDIEKSLSELYRVTKPGGFLYIMTDNAWWQTLVSIKNRFAPSEKRYDRFVQPLDGDFEVSEMKQLLMNANFKIYDFFGYGGIPFGNGLIEKVTGKETGKLPIFQRLTSRMVYIAQK